MFSQVIVVENEDSGSENASLISGQPPTVGGSTSITLTKKLHTASLPATFVCVGCGEIWTVERRKANSTHGDTYDLKP